MRSPESFLEYRLLRLSERLQRRFAAALTPHGLTPRQFSVLAVLAASPGVTPAELARAVLTTPQSMGPLLDQLEAAGLIAARPHRGRGVAVPVRTTEAGTRRFGDAAATVTALDAETRRLLGEDYEILAAVLDTWGSHLP